MASKQTFTKNNPFVLLRHNTKNFQFLQDEAEVQRLKDDGDIRDGDVVVALSVDNIRLAAKKEYTELK